MNVAFLLGAGISRDVLPLSTSIGDIVLAGKASDGRTMARDSVALYDLMRPYDPRRARDPWTPRVIRLLSWLSGWLPADQRDYEALYYACQQVYDEVVGEYDNPILRPFIDVCKVELPRWWGHDDADDSALLSPLEKLSCMMREATNYIGGAVEATLRPEIGVASRLHQLHAPLLGACHDAGIRFVDIITLNHDTLLEMSLGQAGLPFEDGFKRSRVLPKVMQWGGYKRKGRARVRLVKLHGSVDWWEVKHKRGPARALLVRADGYPGRLADRKGRQWDGVGNGPSILVGTSNKMLNYLRPGNLTRLVVFRRALMQTEALVIAGYSFRDKGVNNLLFQWARKGRQMVVLNPSLRGNDAPEKSRSAIKRQWPKWVAAGVLKPLRTKFDEQSWPSLRVKLTNSGA